MNILLVDNNTKHKNALLTALKGHDVETVFYHPGLNIREEDKDLVILSGGGGEGREIDDKSPMGDLWYKDEIEFVQRSTKPIIGICMGFEIICRAFGNKVEEMDDVIKGFKELKAGGRDSLVVNRELIRQFESHKWHVASIEGNDFKVLARSPTGIEMIKHKSPKKSIIATQFHPEIPGGSIKLNQLVASVAH